MAGAVNQTNPEGTQCEHRRAQSPIGTRSLIGTTQKPMVCSAVHAYAVGKAAEQGSRPMGSHDLAMIITDQGSLILGELHEMQSIRPLEPTGAIRL